MVYLQNFTIAFAAAAFALTASVVAWAQSQEEASWLVVLHGKVTDASAEELALATGPRGVAFADRPKRVVQLIDIRDLGVGIQAA